MDANRENNRMPHEQPLEPRQFNEQDYALLEAETPELDCIVVCLRWLVFFGALALLLLGKIAFADNPTPQPEYQVRRATAWSTHHYLGRGPIHVEHRLHWRPYEFNGVTWPHLEPRCYVIRFARLSETRWLWHVESMSESEHWSVIPVAPFGEPVVLFEETE